jgi:hypothetical protein
MSDADFILGKRGSQQQECDSVDRSKDCEEEGTCMLEGSQKKGRRKIKLDACDGLRDDSEATSLGAAGQLTGSQGATRQAQ